MNLIKFSRRDPNGSDPFIDAARIVSWQAIERGSRITLDTGDSVLVGDAPNAVLGLLNQARKKATMPAELAWTRELPTREGLYAWRDDWNEDTAVGTLLVVLECQGRFVAGEAFGNGSHQCLSCLDPIADYEGGEFLGPLPE